MQILPLNSSDLDLLPQIQPSDWADIRIPVRFYLETEYCYSFKAVIDGILVGTGTGILHKKTGWLATIVTHGQYRNQGIGKRITQHLLAFLQKQNCEYIYLIATALGEPVYSKVGFITESRYNYFRDINLKDLEISEHITPYQLDYKQAIFELDAAISGEDRSQHVATFLADSSVYLHNEKIEGVYFPSFGDGLIVAKTAKAGLELMKKRFQTFNMASFPEENRTANDFMVSHGYEPVMTHARMHFGKQMTWQPAGLYNRVGGNIG
ncbi:MAG: N-acetyltransferase [Runella slithyformis]|jgi:GNAT superfamily N-acetyltransferase|nr:MAG: N-acetyltransferase [Runella slithyformis]TAF95361.1 MAG: N-acetyltransferase [Runella sp.]TAG18750.1 MAG: N-acetyltransferase [Cytophagales bacterium]TAG38059.1 MAG: N-acetyltransferase [Cytophagia bacterium]TAE99001.1 MAG: N-acetyltransferase [Runella slithyformis]